MTDTEKVQAIKSLLASGDPPAEPPPSRRTSSPEEALADLRDWGYDLKPGRGGSLYLVQVRPDTGPLPRWLQRHLREHWTELARLIHSR